MNQPAKNLVSISLLILASLLIFQGFAQAQYSVLYNFAGGSDGSYPISGLVRVAGSNFYGTTRLGRHIERWHYFHGIVIRNRNPPA